MHPCLAYAALVSFPDSSSGNETSTARVRAKVHVLERAGHVLDPVEKLPPLVALYWLGPGKAAGSRSWTTV